MRLINYITANFKNKRNRNIFCSIGMMGGIILYIVISIFSTNYASIVNNYFVPFQGYYQIVGQGTNFFNVIPTGSNINESTYNDMIHNNEFKDLSLYPVMMQRSSEFLPSASIFSFVLLFGIPVNMSSTFFSNIQLNQGRWANNSSEIVVGDSFSTILNYTLNESVTIMNKTFTIVGFLQPLSTFLDSLVIIDLPTLQQLYQTPNDLSVIFVSKISAEQHFQSSSLLKSAFKQNYPSLVILSDQDLNELSFNLIATINKYSLIFRSLALLVSIIFTFTMVFFNINDRKQEICTLRSMGIPKNKLFLLILGEVSIILLIGLILGLPIGIFLYSLIYMIGKNSNPVFHITFGNALGGIINNLDPGIIINLAIINIATALICAGISFYISLQYNLQKELRTF